jgi:endoribonuclease Dicer
VPSVDGTPARVLAAVIVHNEVVAKGVASSGRNAKVKASEKALTLLEGLAAFEFRKQYSCDCRPEADGVPVGGESGDAV